MVFFAIGFETTAPSTALTLQRAKQRGVKNFSVFSNHVTIVPAIRAILHSPGMRLDAFIGPGHVSTVTGARPYLFIASDYAKPVVVAGFEPLDLLQSILDDSRAAERREGVGRSAIPAGGAMGGKRPSARRRWPTCSTCGRISNGVGSDSFRNRR